MSDTSERYSKFARKLSTDKPYESMYPSLGTFIIYANGSKWMIDCWVTWELYWITSNVDVKSIEYAIPVLKDRKSSNLEYKSTWLSEKRHRDNIRRIIWKHPNLTDWRWRWLPASVIEFLWRFGLRFTAANYR